MGLWVIVSDLGPSRRRSRRRALLEHFRWGNSYDGKDAHWFCGLGLTDPYARVCLAGVSGLQAEVEQGRETNLAQSDVTTLKGRGGAPGRDRTANTVRGGVDPGSFECHSAVSRPRNM
jgi:hypothetical protein